MQKRRNENMKNLVFQLIEHLYYMHMGEYVYVWRYHTFAYSIL